MTWIERFNWFIIFRFVWSKVYWRWPPGLSDRKLTKLCHEINEIKRKENYINEFLSSWRCVSRNKKDFTENNPRKRLRLIWEISKKLYSKIEIFHLKEDIFRLLSSLWVGTSLLVLPWTVRTTTTVPTTPTRWRARLTTRPPPAWRGTRPVPCSSRQVTPPVPGRRLCPWSPDWDTLLGTPPITPPGHTVPSTAPARPAPGSPSLTSTMSGHSGRGSATPCWAGLEDSPRPGLQPRRRTNTWTPPG